MWVWVRAKLEERVCLYDVPRPELRADLHCRCELAELLCRDTGEHWHRGEPPLQADFGGEHRGGDEVAECHAVERVQERAASGATNLPGMRTTDVRACQLGRQRASGSWIAYLSAGSRLEATGKARGLTVAARGASYSSASSPKESPGPIRPTHTKLEPSGLPTYAARVPFATT